MLLQVPLLLLFISMFRGTVIADQSKEFTREEKGLDSAAWQYLFEKLYFNKTKGPEPYKGGNVTITEDTGLFCHPKLIKKVPTTDDDDDGDDTMTDETTDATMTDGTMTEDTTDATMTDGTMTRHGGIIGETIAFNATVPITPDVVQLKVHIKYLKIRGPEEGNCDTDLLVITGTNPGPEIPVLCGVVNNQTLYLDVDNVVGPVLFTMKLSIKGSMDQMWNITITKLREPDSVPRRCLQYLTATTGRIKSFNYGMMLNEQTYSICFGYVVGYCHIAFTFEKLDLNFSLSDCSDDEYLFIGEDKHCKLKDDDSIKVKATGPISIGVRSDDSNEMREDDSYDKGFSAKYLMLGC